MGSCGVEPSVGGDVSTPFDDVSPRKSGAKWSLIKQLTGTDEAAGRRCLSGLHVLIKQLTGVDQLADRCLSSV